MFVYTIVDVYFDFCAIELYDMPYNCLVWLNITLSVPYEKKILFYTVKFNDSNIHANNFYLFWVFFNLSLG